VSFKPITPKQQAKLVQQIRSRQEAFAERGGTRCHCGGLIYPPGGTGRYTCTHGGEPIARAEIAAFWEGWAEP
jgi:hypothetical protein